jgi:hypothetical protein
MATKLGIYSILIGFFVGLFAGISKFMNIDNGWVDLTISRFTGEYSDTIVEFIPVGFIQEGLFFVIYELPFAVAILGLGLFFFLVGAILKEH